MQKVRTLFISDVHLGNSNSQPKKLLKVLKDYEFENLIIVGDFIDLTALKRRFYWNQDHSTVIQKILRLSRKGVNIVYILGNHDFYIRGLIEDGPVNLGDILICDEYIYKTLNGERIYITHGDQFDGFIRLHPFLYVLGDKAYSFSIWINKFYNKIRRIFGLNYWSLSAYLKTRVKNVIKFISEYKKLSTEKLEELNCDSIMIGHTHTPDCENGRYYNTGDFCETCSYIIETEDGEIKLCYIKDL
jgi:UDP-2,3-diacylglucosamine pyrophosphatase LpxH